MASLLYRLGKTAFRHWPRFIAGWFVLLIVVVGVAAGFSKPFTDAFTIPGIPSEQAQTLQAELFPGSGDAFSQANDQRGRRCTRGRDPVRPGLPAGDRRARHRPAGSPAGGRRPGREPSARQPGGPGRIAARRRPRRGEAERHRPCGGPRERAGALPAVRRRTGRHHRLRPRRRLPDQRRAGDHRRPRRSHADRARRRPHRRGQRLRLPGPVLRGRHRRAGRHRDRADDPAAHVRLVRRRRPAHPDRGLRGGDRADRCHRDDRVHGPQLQHHRAVLDDRAGRRHRLHAVHPGALPLRDASHRRPLPRHRHRRRHRRLRCGLRRAHRPDRAVRTLGRRASRSSRPWVWQRPAPC